MKEDRQNESLPYPKMDIDFHLREYHSKGTVIYYSTIVTKIHYLVKYRCCFCSAENRDVDQFFQLEKHIRSHDNQTRLEKEDQVVRDIKKHQGKDAAAEIEKNIEMRDYYFLSLKCSCARCRKKQPWSDFWPVGGFFKAIGSFCADQPLMGVLFFIYFPTVFVVVYPRIYKIVKPQIADTVLIIVLLFLLCMPIIVPIVHNMCSQKKSLSLEEKYRPEISIVYVPKK